MNWKKYILRFPQEHINFRLPVNIQINKYLDNISLKYSCRFFYFKELQSILDVSNIPHKLPPNIEDEVINKQI